LFSPMGLCPAESPTASKTTTAAKTQALDSPNVIETPDFSTFRNRAALKA